jgi:uncharacterized protein (TIGR02271 family)
VVEPTEPGRLPHSGRAGSEQEDGTASRTIPVVQEELEVRKQRIETGRVRIRKVVDEREALVDEPLRREEAVVRRVAVNREVEPGCLPAVREEDGVLIIPVLEEVAVVERRLMLKEEIHVERRQRETRAQQRVALRSERAVVERIPGSSGASDAMKTDADSGECRMQHTLVGVYDDRTEAEQVRRELLDEGFDNDEVMVRSNGGSGTTETTSATRDSEHEGGIVHFFKSIFGMEDDDERHAQRYSDAVHRGNAVVTVHADSEDRIERAERIMSSHNPINIEEDDQLAAGQAASAVGASMASTTDISVDRPPTGMTADINRPQGGTTADSSEVIPVVEEELQVGKRAVQRGGVRVISRVQEQPVEEQVRLREERATVERNTVDRPATEADFAALRDGEIEVRETAEEAVVGKRARVVEEVRVGKDVSERTETVRDTVRRTDVDVQQLDGGAAGDYRQHWQSRYGAAGERYEDYEPAYTYGSSLAQDERYRGRDWTLIETDARSDWEARHPGTWERMKESIRHAWDRARS